MKTIKSKKLNRQINTICDFKSPRPTKNFNDTGNETGTDPTNITVTTITTINTHINLQYASA